MDYEFAPLEGITDAVYRRTHHRFYPGAARYYTPFISPTQHHIFTPRELRELSPENNPGFCLVPQLLGKNADDMLWAANELAAMGYTEINLNLGCPSGTVTAKGKGAGMLAKPEALDTFLERLFSAPPLSISVKTRLGISSPDEFRRILEIFDRYPLRRLIIHPRTASEMYAGSVHMDAFTRAAQNTAHPIVYNGDLRTKKDILRVTRDFPKLSGIMLGRGLVARPWLISRSSGDKTLLHSFHNALCAEYPVVFGSASSAMHRMKAIWAYMLDAFAAGEAYRKKLIKAKNWPDFLSVTDEIFGKLDLKQENAAD